MNMYYLNYLITISEEKSFTNAAKRLYVSQPSLSLCVKTIEKELGVTLFDRTQTPIELTEAGKIYVNWAKTVILMKQETESIIKDLADDKRTLLRVGGPYERIRSYITPIMPRFQKERPLCKVEIIEDQSARIQRLLANEEIDFAISSNNENPILYNSISICEEVPILAVPKSLFVPLEEDNGVLPESVELSRFSELAFITLGAEQTYGHYFRKLCLNSGFIPKIQYECRMSDTMHDLVAGGLGAALITKAMYNRSKSPDVYYFKLKNIPPTRMVYLNYRIDKYLSKDAEVMMNLLREANK